MKAQLEKLVEKRLGMEAGAKAEAVEREIDKVVYGLYGLTAAEIAIVEGSGRPSSTERRTSAGKKKKGKGNSTSESRVEQ